MMLVILHLPFSGQLVLFLQLQPKDVSFGFKMFLLWVDKIEPYRNIYIYIEIYDEQASTSKKKVFYFLRGVYNEKESISKLVSTIFLTSILCS